MAFVVATALGINYLGITYEQITTLIGNRIHQYALRVTALRLALLMAKFTARLMLLLSIMTVAQAMNGN